MLNSLKFILFILLFGAAFCGSSQIVVAFEVDMNNVTVSPDGVHITGNFQNPDNEGFIENPTLTQWDPAAHSLTDPDLDGIYTTTLELFPTLYEFKFVNGNTLEAMENVPGACSVDLVGNNNRSFLVGGTDNTYSVCYEHCTACGNKSARIRIDMSGVDIDADGIFAEYGQDISVNGIFVAGDFQNPSGTEGDWNPSLTRMFDINGDNIYEATVEVGTMDQIEYSIIDGNSWSFPYENIVGVCGNGLGNRLDSLPDADNILPLYCWNSCGACSPMVDVTFNVNMNTFCGDLTDGVFLVGSLTNWNAGIAMTDLDDDGIWSCTISQFAGNFEYKFRVGTNGWELMDIGNRTLEIDGTNDIALPTVCFNSLLNCPDYQPPSDLTFKVQPALNAVPSGQSVWLMGDFTEPTWQQGAIQMTLDSATGIWSALVNDLCPQFISYKFAIGLTNLITTSDWQEEDADFSSIGGCGIDNLFYSDFRFYTRSDSNPVELCFQFNSCQPCAIAPGCTNPVACNYNADATWDNATCILVNGACDDGNIATLNDIINANCECAGEVPQEVCGVDLFISEYVEGQFNNKAIEIFNPNSVPVVLDGSYSFGRYRDGALVPMLMPIGGVIAPHGVRVFALDKRDPNGVGTEMPIFPELEAVADTFVNPITDLSNSPFYFNGDDGFVLMHNDVMIDFIGVIGVDPGFGWSQPGDPNNIPWTMDRTMVRKPEVYQGIFTSPAVFDPSIEWDTLSVNDFSHLGWHTFFCANLNAGCNDVNACNYAPDVTNDPALCIYPGCDDPLACNYAPDLCGGGTCNYSGCDDPAACNYVPGGCGDNVCVYPGCDDPAACNYVPGVCGDGSCVYPGCDDPLACNYVPGACGDGSCIFPGCDDPGACNYDPAACAGGECVYPGCNDPLACNYTNTVCGGGNCIYPEIDGDIDCSGAVDETDVIQLLDIFGCIEACDVYDFDNDGIVGVNDIIILMSLIGM